MIIWLASYPKSGNTWIRFFILSLLTGKKTDLNLNHLRAIANYPDKSHFNGLISDYLNLDEVAKNWINSQSKINIDKNLRFFKTHNMLGKFKNYPFTDKNNTIATIHIVRDPRNVITSLKNHYNLSNYNDAKRFLFFKNQILSLSNQEKEKYLNKEKHPLPQFIGSWQTHYLSWKNMKMNYLLVKYEDLLNKPIQEFTKISNFIGKIVKNKFTDENINDAINLSSFENLKRMEDKHGFTESPVNKDGEKNKFFFLGPKNNWKKILDQRTVNEINIEFSEEMKELGYL